VKPEKQRGRFNRYTAEELALVRDVYHRWGAVRMERMRLQARLGMRTDVFCRVGQGLYGKKPFVPLSERGDRESGK
jgi:hypothetical protein